ILSLLIASGCGDSGAAGGGDAAANDLGGGGAVDARAGDLAPSDAATAAPFLVQANHLVHLGSFRVPGGIHIGSAMAGFEYGGTAIGFNPMRGSLYITGHDWDQLTAEISIPAFDATAQLLQPLVDALEGH